MKNKIIIIFVIIFNLIVFKVYSDDQISFDVSEIEILDGGDKIIGKNRGKITTNNGITITADEFLFDKIKNIIEAKGNIIIEDKINNYNFSAQNISYEKNEEKIKIKGKSNALIETNYEFETEDITIFRNESIISSDMRAIILDKAKKTRYEIDNFSYSLNEKILKGKNIFINTKFDQPFSDKYFFKSAVFDLENQNYIAQDIDISFKKDIFGNKKKRSEV